MPSKVNQQGQHLLAVDVGLHTGLALFEGSGRLLWYRSQHLANQVALKKFIAGLLRNPPRPTHIYLEGGGPLADLWIREADKLALKICQIAAESWRSRLLLNRQQTSAARAKQEATSLARNIIEQLGGKKPTSLRHDTAEAVLIGYFGLQQLGWIP